MKKRIYTIGYGNRRIEEFIALLKKHGVNYLVDVRTYQFSKKRLEFSRKNLPRLLKKHGIHYESMGRGLGGKPSDKTLYTNGKPDYDKISKSLLFKEELEDLISMSSGMHPVVIMCSELDHTVCHRSKLVGRELLKREVDVYHIDRNGGLVKDTSKLI